jgi:hypothetical protein
MRLTERLNKTTSQACPIGAYAIRCFDGEERLLVDSAAWTRRAAGAEPSVKAESSGSSTGTQETAGRQSEVIAPRLVPDNLNHLFI